MIRSMFNLGEILFESLFDVNVERIVGKTKSEKINGVD